MKRVGAVGTCLDYPHIPEGEVWISSDVPLEDRPALFQLAVAELERARLSQVNLSTSRADFATICLSTETPAPAKVEDPRATSILKRALAGFSKLTSRIRAELFKALKGRGPGASMAARRVLAKHLPALTAAFSDTQLASALSGMQFVADRVPEAVLEAGRRTFPTPGQGGPMEPAFGPLAPAEEPEPIHFPIIDEAVKDLAGRQLLTRRDYDQLSDEARRQAFTVAGVESEAVLGKVQEALAEGVAEGETLKTFKERVEEAVGEGTFLSPAHAETVFRTNVQAGYATGQDRVLDNVVVNELFPYVEHIAIHDDRVRPDHLALEKCGLGGGPVFRRDDPVIKLFSVPMGFNCRCGRNPLTVRQAAAKGVKEAQAWLASGLPPSKPQHVPMPPFSPPPGWRRDVGVMLSLARYPDYTEPKPQESDDQVIEETESATTPLATAAPLVCPSCGSHKVGRYHGDAQCQHCGHVFNADLAALATKFEPTDLATKKEAGHWITIGGRKGEDGRHGGSPVYIENGRITKGAPSLHGRKIDALKEEPDRVEDLHHGASKEEKKAHKAKVAGQHRAEMYAGRGYHRAKHAKAAREHGIKAEHLHQLAGEILAHDKAFVEDRKGLLQDARKLSESLGYGNINNLRQRAASGRLDADAVRGLDDVAERIAERYPEHFHSHEDAQERLFELLSAGNPEPMSEDDAYEQATEQLREGQAAAEPEDDSQENTWQRDAFGGEHSIARQRPMFDETEEPSQKPERDYEDLPGQQLLPGTEHNVKKKSRDVPFTNQFSLAADTRPICPKCGTDDTGHCRSLQGNAQCHKCGFIWRDDDWPPPNVQTEADNGDERAGEGGERDATDVSTSP